MWLRRKWVQLTLRMRKNLGSLLLCTFYVPDLSNAKKNWNKTPGYTEAETTSFKNILHPPSAPQNSKFVDVWRHFHPTDRHYTYFSYRFNCREKGLGWRLDMCKCHHFTKTNITISTHALLSVVLSERILEKTKMVSLSLKYRSNILMMIMNPSVRSGVKYTGLQIIAQLLWNLKALYRLHCCNNVEKSSHDLT